MRPESQATKENIDKLDFTKIKNVCASKGTFKKVKRQPMEWEEIVANHMSGKGLRSGIYKELLQFTTTTTKTKNPFKNGQRS